MNIGVFVQNRDFFGAKLVHAPLFYSLQKTYPSATITALCPYKDNSLFTQIGLAHETLFYERGFISAIKTLAKKKWDLLICLRPEPIWLNLAIATKIHTKKWGFHNPISFLIFQRALMYNKSIYRALALQSFLEISGFDYFHQYPKKSLPSKPSVFILAGGGAGEFKRWGIDNFLEVCRTIYHPGMEFYFVLGKQEDGYLSKIKHFQEQYPCKILYNQSLAELTAHFQSADLLISNDCGPAHIAHMLQKPMVNIFSNEYGSADSITAEWFLPHADAKAIVGEKGADIKQISTSIVIAACLELLQKERSSDFLKTKSL